MGESANAGRCIHGNMSARYCQDRHFFVRAPLKVCFGEIQLGKSFYQGCVLAILRVAR